MIYSENTMNAATNVTIRATETLTRSTFQVNGIALELVTHKTGKGRVEVYQEWDDGCGTMRFMGNYDEVCVANPKVAERAHQVLAQHQAAHRDFWRTYLPGASTWLAA